MPEDHVSLAHLRTFAALLQAEADKAWEAEESDAELRGFIKGLKRAVELFAIHLLPFKV